MMLTTRRPTSRIDMYDNTTLLQHEYDTNINLKKTDLYSPSPPPMSYRDLRSFMFNKTPLSSATNVVIIPESLNSTQKLVKNSSNVITVESPRKNSHRKKHSRQGIDVYRSLIRTDSRCSASSERDLTNDEMMILANSFIIDHIISTPTSGFFHPQNLPNIQRHRTIHNSVRIGSSYTKISHTSSPSLYIQHFGRKRSTTPQRIHRTSPIDVQHETTTNNMTTTATTTITTTEFSSPIPESQTRKQLHVYMPHTVSC
ncbi:unnamed protein product [Rotaria sordida]|uniref:Uncharacterized protein n=1 Tax=Rotaria sordida TaxID=392033 RepID=A0A818P6C7_9BILA|nr:unnamed protein product [Rotaria sordida]CAF0744013.1 unnamed protein product [Rotaria sordida]CAF0758191.1 unnamed protein product [Rotaria sordida]CAF3529872.1 unnamed protein product [Rotaria sordida]CAF3614560.1 unnamed protein product [Rotaria sordida]